MMMNYRVSLKGGGSLFGDERWCDGREHGEHKAVKERCRSGTQSAFFYPDNFCCSSGLPSRSALGVLYSRGTSS